MALTTIPYSERLGFSKLFRDFIDGDDRILKFFEAGTFDSSTEALRGRSYDRDTIADILRRQNEKWAAPQSVLNSIDRIKEKNAVAVFTGQQACLFGGPYLIMLKAIAAVKRARKLERDLSVPVLPIFWIAADDHDIGEVAGVHIFDRAGAMVQLCIDYDDEAPSPPIGVREYDESVVREVKRLAEILPDNDFQDSIIKPMEEIYRPGEKIVDSFARYLFSILGVNAPILFSPYDGQFKESVAPFLSEIIDGWDEIKKVLTATDSRLRDIGYHLQVKKADTAAHLFIHTPSRVAIHWDGDRYAVDRRTFTAAELKDALSSRPFDFSPDVFTRPLVQSYFFPAIAIIGGPAEVAYYAQLMPLFEIFDLVKPHIMARPSLTIVEPRHVSLMETHELTLDDLAGDFGARITEILADTFPDRLDRSISEYKRGVMNGLEDLREELLEYDPALSGMVNHTSKKIDYLVSELGKKVFAAHKKKNKTERDRLRRLQDNLFPDRNPAERSIAPLYFMSRYGREIIDFVFGNMRLDETGHQLLLLTDYDER